MERLTDFFFLSLLSVRTGSTKMGPPIMSYDPIILRIMSGLLQRNLNVLA